MNHNIYIYIFVMAAVTYLIRMLPLTLIRKEIKSTYIKSFLYYVRQSLVPPQISGLHLPDLSLLYSWLTGERVC